MMNGSAGMIFLENNFNLPCIKEMKIFKSDKHPVNLIASGLFIVAILMAFYLPLAKPLECQCLSISLLYIRIQIKQSDDDE